MPQSQEHADLRNLRLWIDRIAFDYKKKMHPRQWDNRGHKKNLESIQRIIEGTSRGSTKDDLRGLIATGVMQYKNSIQEIPREAPPETLMLDLVVDALWPIVIAPNLSGAWLDSLAELTSPQLVSLVSRARAAGISMNRRVFLRRDRWDVFRGWDSQPLGGPQ
jgi:hypothetical protein